MPFFTRDSGEVLVSTGRAGVWKSSDHAEHWRISMRGYAAPSGARPFADEVCQAPSAPATLYLVAGFGRAVTYSIFSGLFRSDDFGETWTRLASLPAIGGFPDCTVAPGDANLVYVLSSTFSGSPITVWRSADGGRSFRAVGGGLPPLDSPSFARHAPDGTLYLGDNGTYQGLYASSDGGRSFRRLAAAPKFPGLLFAHPSAGTLFVIGDDASNLYRSTDHGASFTPVSGLPSGVSFVGFEP
jgi:photosystem II stability/assembly factor-like uncharacterized protein